MIQTNREGISRSIYFDEWTGGIVASESFSSAKSFETLENAKEFATVLNQMYQLTNQDFKIEVIHEVVSREPQST